MKSSEILSEITNNPTEEIRKLAFLLDAFDSTDNAVSIYDKDACLLYGNAAYLKSMHLKDLKSVLGMNILDITKQSKIKIHAMKTDSNRPKMLDVLRTGKKMLDWEVAITAESSSNSMQLVSYNMYPIKDIAGHVQGMIEISTTQQLNLNSTKKIMGLTAEYTFDSIVGSSSALQNAIMQAKEYSTSPYSLLIVGESGVGKELFSQAVHNESDRAQGPFVAINCANFPENLIESELFGYVSGAFTGASKNGQMGKFELADGGTLFLDEIGELPLNFQSKLLRVLETHQVTRIGSNTPTMVNVRIIAATNRDLQKMIDEGLFRKDLYYRLQVLTVEIPPLRERLEDVADLAETFLAQAAEVNGEDPKSLSSEAKKVLMQYSWPGNIRELKNVIQRVAVLSKKDMVDDETLQAAIYSKGYAFRSESRKNTEILQSNGPDTAEDFKEEEQEAIRIETSEKPASSLESRFQEVYRSHKALLDEALKLAAGNKTKAAELLGVTRQTIYRLMKKYDGEN